MTRESIDEFLSKNEQIAQRIRRISEEYALSDFVKVVELVRERLKNSTASTLNCIFGCIYDIRKGHLRINVESVESRLTNEYLEYLLRILEREEVSDKVFYIVAYHYLTLAKQLGYQLTATHNSAAPFRFVGNEMCTLAKKNYAKLQELFDEGVFAVLNYFDEEDIKYYNKIYSECGYNHHAVKHFSLIENMMGFASIVSRYKFEYEFKKVLDLFVFHYRAIYTDERMHSYMYQETKEKVIRELVDI